MKSWTVRRRRARTGTSSNGRPNALTGRGLVMTVTMSVVQRSAKVVVVVVVVAAKEENGGGTKPPPPPPPAGHELRRVLTSCPP